MLKKNEDIHLEQPVKQSVAKQLIIKLFRSTMQIALMVAILFGAFWGMNRMIDTKEEPAKRPPFKSVYSIDSVIVEKSTFQPSMVVYGEVQAAKSVELRSLVAGKIIEVNPKLKVGGRIEKDAPLFKIDPFNFETALTAAISNRDETLARIAENEGRVALEKVSIKSLTKQLELARSDMERISALRERGTATTRDVEDRSLIMTQREQAVEQSRLNLIIEEARIDQLRNVLARFERGIVEAERNLEDTVLRSPMTGIVSVKNAAVGRIMAVNDIAVFMYEADRLEVRFTLTDQRFGRIQSDSQGVIGREVEVIWTIGGKEFRYKAVIDRIGAQITSNRGGVEVIAKLDGPVNDSALRPGAFVEIIVPDKSFEDQFRIPETALYDDDTIYVVVDGKLQRREVSLLARDGDYIILQGEFVQGDEILTTRIAEISQGLAVANPNRTSQTAGANQ